MRQARRKKSANQPSRRASISFPPELYETVERIAEANKVSFAWLVREAVEKYVAERWPLLEGR
jgi:predicted DNA-binding protein